MRLKRITGIALAVLLVGMLTLAFNIQRAESLEPPATEWTRTYGGASGDGAGCVVQTSDGEYALAGSTGSFGAGGADFWLVKTDSSGNMEWNKTYGGTDDDMGHSMVQTGDGGYAIAGRTNSSGAGDYDAWLVKVAGPPPPVGGVWIPVDKLGLLAPYIGLASTIILATVATAAFVKYKKKR